MTARVEVLSQEVFVSKQAITVARWAAALALALTAAAGTAAGVPAYAGQVPASGSVKTTHSSGCSSGTSSGDSRRLVSPDGYILIGNHVVDGASAIKVALQDRREFQAKLVGRDAKTDVAVLKIQASGLKSLVWMTTVASSSQGIGAQNRRRNWRKG